MKKKRIGMKRVCSDIYVILILKAGRKIHILENYWHWNQLVCQLSVDQSINQSTVDL